MSDPRALPSRSDRACGPWLRVVTEPVTNGAEWAHVQTTEYLDEKAAVERLWEAMRERPEAALRDWFDYALNGGGEDD